jgi:hypothetical protein
MRKQYCIISVGDPAPYITGTRLPLKKGTAAASHFYKFILPAPAPSIMAWLPASESHFIGFLPALAFYKNALLYWLLLQLP